MHVVYQAHGTSVMGFLPGDRQEAAGDYVADSVAR
jgi:hypothetical protein